MPKDKRNKNTEEHLKYFELTVYLPKENDKSFFFVAPATSNIKLIENLQSIVFYLLEHRDVRVEVIEMS